MAGSLKPYAFSLSIGSTLYGPMRLKRTNPMSSWMFLRPRTVALASFCDVHKDILCQTSEFNNLQLLIDTALFALAYIREAFTFRGSIFGIMIFSEPAACIDQLGLISKQFDTVLILAPTVSIFLFETE
jgi:hypothetical protein